MSPGPAIFCGLTLCRVLRTSAGSRQSTTSSGMGGFHYCCVVHFVKPAEEGVKYIEEVSVVITGWLGGPVVRDKT